MVQRILFPWPRLFDFLQKSLLDFFPSPFLLVSCLTLLSDSLGGNNRQLGIIIREVQEENKKICYYFSFLLPRAIIFRLHFPSI